jgi:ribosomal-protein-alanine N-acetyltransferase
MSLKRLQEKQLCLLCPAMDDATKIMIRPMTEKDLDAVTTIEQASYTTPWNGDHFRNEITAGYSWPFVAVIEGVVVGYLCLMCLFEEAQILNIAVGPDFRGRGIARLLLKHAFLLALEQGAEFVALEVRSSNSVAISLYEQLGFSKTGIRARYYEHTEDAVLMEKSLKENQ